LDKAEIRQQINAQNNMRKKFEFRKLSKVKEEAHDKEVRSPDVRELIEEETAGADHTRESTWEVTKDIVRKKGVDAHEEKLMELEEERLYLLNCMGTTHFKVADAAKAHRA
jgi:hypothetical protein